MGIKEITKEQADELFGYCCGEVKSEILNNGQSAYCKETKTVVICCGNCGEYEQVEIKDLLQ